MTMAKAGTKKAKAPISVEKIREKLGDRNKKISVEMPMAFFRGRTPEFFTAKAIEMAKEGGIVGDFTLSYRDGRYNYNTHRSEGAKIVLTGERPYTDEELLKEGERIIKREEKREKEAKELREKQIRQIEELAAKAGVKVEIDDPS